MRSYEMDHVNALWHTDFHHGSKRVLLADGLWNTPLLFGVIDDHSRLICHLHWYGDERLIQIKEYSPTLAIRLIIEQARTEQLIGADEHIPVSTALERGSSPCRLRPVSNDQRHFDGSPSR